LLRRLLPLYSLSFVRMISLARSLALSLSAFGNGPQEDLVKDLTGLVLIFGYQKHVGCENQHLFVGKK
jgi:hypothetical protein